MLGQRDSHFYKIEGHVKHFSKLDTERLPILSLSRKICKKLKFITLIVEITYWGLFTLSRRGYFMRNQANTARRTIVLALSIGTLSLLVSFGMAQEQQTEEGDQQETNQEEQVTTETQGNNAQENIAQEDKNKIPEEFKRIGKGLPPSKRRELQRWLYNLQFKTPYPRMRAAREIYWYKQEEAIPYLVTALRDSYWGVRYVAAKALAYIDTKKYEYTKYTMPSGSKIRQILISLQTKNIPLEKKGDILLNAERINKNKITVDVIKELKKAYYREVQFFKNEAAKMSIRTALEDLGATKPMDIESGPGSKENMVR